MPSFIREKVYPRTGENTRDRLEGLSLVYEYELVVYYVFTLHKTLSYSKTVSNL